MAPIRSLSLPGVLVVLCAAALAGEAPGGPYPPARRADVVDVLHGVRVPDPYRWLEEADSPETRAFVAAQNKLARAFLSAVPERDAIRRRLTKLWDYERVGLPVKRGSSYFFTRNPGLRPQAVLCVADAPDAEGRALLDPNALSEDGTVALGRWVPSEDGKLLAYGISTAGSDWAEWRVRDVATGKDLPDRLRWIKHSSAAWTHDGAGFFYGRYPQPKEGTALREANYFNKLYYHRLGTDQAQDVLIYERPDQKEWAFGAGVTDDGRYLLIVARHGTDPAVRVYYKDLRDAKNPAVGSDSPVVPLLAEGDADYDFVGNDGATFYFVTDRDAPRKKLIALDLTRPGREHWKTIIPEAADALGGVDLAGDRFIASYVHDAHTRVRVFGLDGGHVRDVDLPGIGSARGFGGRREQAERFYTFTSFTTPSCNYRYDVASGTSTLLRRPNVDFDPGAYESRQVWFTSKDGTRVPMFITHRKGLKLDGSNPTYLYGYGGFRSSMTPYFTPSIAVWLELGGVYAVPNLRGGGEYGAAWHDAGRKLAKQNTFDDFLAAAQWLIENKYTSREKLAIGGGSNGGLLVGAAMTQRPDLYAAAVPAVGVLDMIRFHKFTVGWGWTSDYGSPDDPKEFAALWAYSPYHRVKPGTRYPATLVMTSDHDDRVVPAHSYKFAAALQHAQAPGGPPILLRVETRAGHGAGRPTQKAIDEAADRWAFLVKVLGM